MDPTGFEPVSYHNIKTLLHVYPVFIQPIATIQANNYWSAVKVRNIGFNSLLPNVKTASFEPLRNTAAISERLNPAFQQGRCAAYQATAASLLFLAVIVWCRIIRGVHHPRRASFCQL